MTDSKPENGWPTNQPITGAKSYGGITGPHGEDDEEPKDDAPRQEFPAEDQGTIGNRGPDPAEGEDRSTQPDTKALSPNAGQPQGEDEGDASS
jgi:hypothetical protein